MAEQPCFAANAATSASAPMILGREVVVAKVVEWWWWWWLWWRW